MSREVNWEAGRPKCKQQGNKNGNRGIARIKRVVRYRGREKKKVIKRKNVRIVNKNVIKIR